ncbi:hypothetical protein JOF46_000422 [Paeniglutamicibacter psychrophenolicus]|uniref:Uncharacterized protein n=1 Tax=Paeniglutamicibacter psychrophenolicus TaxID=257454 RepID=A0ABS4W8H2_9MICC|nr:hypothetical protein [Paeniglutamicibacter psychrophenolicus]
MFASASPPKPSRWRQSFYGNCLQNIGEVEPHQRSQDSIRLQRCFPVALFGNSPPIVGRMESAVHFQSFAVPSSLLC